MGLDDHNLFQAVWWAKRARSQQLPSLKHAPDTLAKPPIFAARAGSLSNRAVWLGVAAPGWTEASPLASCVVALQGDCTVETAVSRVEARSPKP